MENPPHLRLNCGVNQKRNSVGIPFEESSTVTPQVEYFFLPAKMDGSPHFILLWKILLIPSVWGEFSKRGALSEFLLRRSNHVTWLWDRTSDKTTCIFIHELYKNDDKKRGPSEKYAHLSNLSQFKSILQGASMLHNMFRKFLHDEICLTCNNCEIF